MDNPDAPSRGASAFERYDLESYRRGHVGPGGVDLAGRAVVVFDLETRHGLERVTDRADLASLGMSLGITFNYQDGLYRTYGEDEAEELLAEIEAAEGVIGYNLVGFDYEVLAGHAPGFAFDRLNTLDLMLEIQRRVGFRPKLDHVLDATLGARKSADGLAALRFYREQEWDLLVDYCLDDVALTRALFEFGRATGGVTVVVDGDPRHVEVDWRRFLGEKGLFD